MSFEEIFDTLLVPRENGSPALAETASYLEKALRGCGANVSLQEFVCRPEVATAAGIVCLALALGFGLLMWKRRFGGALPLALLIPLYLLVDSPGHLPLFSRIGSVPEHNIVATFPVAEPERIVILGAHYDTRTDLLGYYQQAPIRFLLVPALVLAVGVASTAVWRRARGRPEHHVRYWALLVPLYFSAFFLAKAGGMFVSARSPGALDDGAAVATLVKLAERLGAGEPALVHTEVQIVLFAGEEVGLQGSAAYLAEQFSEVPPHPVYFINGEVWGFGRELSYFVYDRSVWRRYEASTPLVRTLDRACRRVTNQATLTFDVQPVTTDARTFLAAGIPAVTVTSHHLGDSHIRYVNTAADDRERVDREALEQTLSFLQAALAEIDGEGVKAFP
jgi:acetylornithine deacetylase/succinyl-diaminopimelate desuccinylase-like protein